MPPGDDRLRTPICHANQGHIAALIHGDVRGDIGDLWWNCEDNRKFDLVRRRIMEGSFPGLLIYLPINQSQPQTHLTGCTLLISTGFLKLYQSNLYWCVVCISRVCR